MYHLMRVRYGVIVLLVLLIGIGVGTMVDTSSGGQGTPFWTETPPKSMPIIQAPNFADLAEHLRPSVVNISTTQVVKGQRRMLPRFPFPSPFGERDPFEEFFERFFGGEGPQREFRRRSLGSGFIITKDGYIVTNNHVVENATDIKISLTDKDEYDAKVVGRDPKTDVALIKIDAKKELPVVALGDSDKLRVGEWVMAIGNPFGLGHTVTAGIVSAKGRIIGAGPYDDFIQTDASINPGNSGGPLFNMNGQVVGINTAIVATGQGIGFAIPINMAKDLLGQLREKGRVVRGWLGVQVQRVTPELAKSFGLDRERGALVADVMPDTPAARAGIERGDIIVEFNGRKIEEMTDLPRVVANTPPGTEVPVKLLRKGQERVVQVTIAEMQEERMAAAGGTLEESLGMTVQELTPEIARSLGVSETKGVVVTNVEDDSPADEAGVRRGDVILEVNQRKIETLKDYRAAIGRMSSADSLLLLIRRGNNVLYVAMKMTQ
ncbi:MAG TPA: DegQ family serine endoprotease [Alphaproteobacteria bacterium]|nr:DegQ family serine endoprotease [Alphaproteobacteria bacterium]